MFLLKMLLRLRIFLLTLVILSVSSCILSTNNVRVFFSLLVESLWLNDHKSDVKFNGSVEILQNMTLTEFFGCILMVLMVFYLILKD